MGSLSVPRKWKDFRNFEIKERQSESLRKFEKIKRGKRSVRGRTTDDWILDGPEVAAEEAATKLAELLESGHKIGRVIEVQKRGAFVAEEHESSRPDTGLLWFCSIAKRHFQRAHKERNFVVVGDKVVFGADETEALNGHGEPESDLPRGVIQHAFARTSRIARKDPISREWEHVMLANIDQVAIVASVLNPTVRWGLIDRFLVQAELERLPAFVVLNKVDLLADPKLANPAFLAEYHERVKNYRDIGYEVYELSALHFKKYTKVCQAIRKRFKGKITGFCGHSGVGKSSIINLMEPEFEQIVDENPEIFYKGRHTTTYNSLLRLGVGGYAIDTPGIRTFAMEDIEPFSLAQSFPEFRKYRCKYRECRHYREVDCRIREALERGEIARGRYRSYIGLLCGDSERQGEGDAENAELIADLEARRQGSDVLISPPEDDILGLGVSSDDGKE
jgi:ribosome biogenesis GTPase